MIAHIEIENKYAKYWIEEDILYFVYKKGISIDLSVAMKVVEDRLSLQQGREFLIFCDARGIKSLNKKARDYFALEGSVLMKAVAILVNNPLNNAILNFYIKTSNPTIKIQTFFEKEEALEFLNNHR
ncbi:hypothetical protein [Flavivirga spongiicola]|uniref:DUF7793 domain-containing protein n=1 Tax=Flavivirga spongiicola TaxID=421621 RepID=A0ABU7XQY4_9FLAO|nr:hypothetical protein [Flavivirga sp. MEBiC05379]MDO5978199.1 hypothetical protein [Flavivirga sp. MEBiC05379]